MVHSKALVFRDFESGWYKKWQQKLKQTPAGRGKFPLKANKFWQNAAITQALYERGSLSPGKHGLGFGVGMERLPALFASLNVKVVATDQEVVATKASQWNNGQLAQGTQSLNIHKICMPDLFAKNVSYRAVDMKNIPRDLDNGYDFVWTNCALGHLGSINAGLKFIEDSLKCLVPGGWAVHTTEAAILSNEHTLDKGDTIFFRQRDLLALSKRLSKAGYEVEALRFKLGRRKDDLRFTLAPPWGTDHSKLLYKGYMATQILLIIHKPAKKIGGVRRNSQILKHTLRYYANLAQMKLYLQRNRKLRKVVNLNRTANLSAVDTNLSRYKDVISLQIKRGSTKKVKLRFYNESGAALFKLSGNFAGTLPLALATDKPTNRNSKFMSDDWHAPNRPSMTLYQRNDQDWQQVEYIESNKDFLIVFQLFADRVKLGKYQEYFCLAKDGDNVIPNTQIKLVIDVKS